MSKNQVPVKGLAPLATLATVVSITAGKEQEEVSPATTATAPIEEKPSSATRQEETVTATPGAGIPKIGKLRATKLLPAKVAAAVNKELEKFGEGLFQNYADLGASLADRANLNLQLPEVLEAERLMAEDILAISGGRPREIAMVAAINGMLKHFPKTIVGLSHLGKQGLAFGFFRLRQSGENDQLAVELPIGEGNAWTKVVTEVEASGTEQAMVELVSASEALLEEIKKAEDEERRVGLARKYQEERKKAEELKARPHFKKVLNGAGGNAVCRFPAGKNYPESYLGMEITASSITVDAVVGARSFQDFIGISISRASLWTPSFRYSVTDTRNQEEVNRMARLRKLLRIAAHAGPKRKAEDRSKEKTQTAAG